MVKWTGDALDIARVLLCMVRLDGGMHTIHVHAAVKTALESEQRRELQRVPQDELRWQRFHNDAAGWSTRTLTGLLPRALTLNKRCSVVDAVPTTTRTPPRVPIRALPAKWLIARWRLEEMACCS